MCLPVSPSSIFYQLPTLNPTAKCWYSGQCPMHWSVYLCKVNMLNYLFYTSIHPWNNTWQKKKLYLSISKLKTAVQSKIIHDATNAWPWKMVSVRNKVLTTKLLKQFPKVCFKGKAIQKNLHTMARIVYKSAWSIKKKVLPKEVIPLQESRTFWWNEFL